jgi:beta-galactosidase/beta-glucuronidase
VGLNHGAAVTNTFIDIYKGDQYPNIEPTQNGTWHIDVSVDFVAAGGKVFELKVGIEGFSAQATVENSKDGMNRVDLHFEIPDDKVQRWWPHTAGKYLEWQARATLSFAGLPTLYNMSLSLGPCGDGDNYDSGAAKWQKQVGFRTVILDLSPSPDGGYNFHFVINGKTINIKGSSQVPYVSVVRPS